MYPAPRNKEKIEIIWANDYLAIDDVWEIALEQQLHWYQLPEPDVQMQTMFIR